MAIAACTGYTAVTIAWLAAAFYSAGTAVQRRLVFHGITVFATMAMNDFSRSWFFWGDLKAPSIAPGLLHLSVHQLLAGIGLEFLRPGSDQSYEDLRADDEGGLEVDVDPESKKDEEGFV
jgi:hypothetical protein